jgi:hypothetical protein
LKVFSLHRKTSKRLWTVTTQVMMNQTSLSPKVFAKPNPDPKPKFKLAPTPPLEPSDGGVFYLLEKYSVLCNYLA